MNLFIMRHGLAAPSGAFKDDFQRPLTSEGEEKTERIARGIAASKVDLDLLYSSPYIRARQTADIVARALGGHPPAQLADALASGASPRSIVRWLREHAGEAESVMLVGHEPDLSRLIAFLLAGDKPLSVTMKKGGLAKLTVEALREGPCATLEWLLTPKHLVSLSN